MLEVRDFCVHSLVRLVISFLWSHLHEIQMKALLASILWSHLHKIFMILTKLFIFISCSYCFLSELTYISSLNGKPFILGQKPFKTKF